MESTDLVGLDEDAIFEAEFRAEHLPSRRLVVLRTKLKPTGKEKLASHSRFEHRTAGGTATKNAQRRKK